MEKFPASLGMTDALVSPNTNTLPHRSIDIPQSLTHQTALPKAWARNIDADTGG